MAAFYYAVKPWISSSEKLRSCSNLIPSSVNGVGPQMQRKTLEFSKLRCKNSERRARDTCPCLPFHSGEGAERTYSTWNLLSFNANFSSWHLQIMSSSVLLKNINFTFLRLDMWVKAWFSTVTIGVKPVPAANKKRSSTSWSLETLKLPSGPLTETKSPIWRRSSSGVKSPAG